MFKNYNISLICRIICLLTFVLVIIFIDNLYVLGILACIIFILVRLDNNIIISIIMILNFIGFMAGYVNGSFLLLRILLIISYSYYFLKDNIYKEKVKIIDNKDMLYDKILKRNENKIKSIMKGEIVDQEIIKDKSDYDFMEYQHKGFEKKYSINKDISMQEVFYVLVHLFLLFISIIIGSCVI